MSQNSKKNKKHLYSSTYFYVIHDWAKKEEIRMFLAFSCYKNFKVYQMDVKSTFLNGDLEEEVYIE